VQFVDRVEGAPEIGDFVFEDTAGEGEDTVDGLGELEKRWVVPCVAVRGEGKGGKKRRKRSVSEIRDGPYVPVIIIEGAEQQRGEYGGEGEDSDRSDGEKTAEVELWIETDAEKVSEDGWGIVQRHLLEAERQDEKDTGPEIST